jgi:hypothetical protein
MKGEIRYGALEVSNARRMKAVRLSELATLRRLFGYRRLRIPIRREDVP